MESTPQDVFAGDTVLSELKREARRQGHVAFTMRSEDFTLYLMWFLGVLLGVTLASGRQ